MNSIIKEEKFGLATIFDIKCNLCGKINKIKTSSEHRRKHGRLTYNINSRAVLGSSYAGIGNTHLNNLVATMQGRGEGSSQLAHNVILTLVKACMNVKAYLTLTQRLHNFAFLI